MEQNSAGKKRGYIIVLIVLGSLLLAASVVAHLQEDYGTYRFLRGLISFSFLAVIIWYKKSKTNILLVLFLLCYGISSFATMAYEDKKIAMLSLMLNFVSLLFIIKALWPRASLKNLGVTLTVVFAALIVVNGYLFYQFITMLKDFAFGNLHYAAMILGAMALVVCSFLSLVYNHSSSSKASLVFTIFVFLIVFAEVFRAIAYYDFGFGNTSVYVARIIIILSTALLAHYAIMPKEPKDEVSKKLF